jgi:hypothetical protein
MASGYDLFCASSLGAIDPRCVPTILPIVPLVSVPTTMKIVPQDSSVNEILGYALFAFALFCVYFCVLCIYKIFRGYSLAYSLKFALCGAQRVIYDRTARLGASLFVTPVLLPVVLPASTALATNPTVCSTPIPMLVLASPEAVPRSLPVLASPEMPLYSDPTGSSDRCLGIVVVVE